MVDLPKYLPGQVIASASRCGVVVSAFKRRFDDDDEAAKPCWGYNIKSVDRRVILERDIIAVMSDEGEWEEVK